MASQLKVRNHGVELGGAGNLARAFSGGQPNLATAASEGLDMAAAGGDPVGANQAEATAAGRACHVGDWIVHGNLDWIVAARTADVHTVPRRQTRAKNGPAQWFEASTTKLGSPISTVYSGRA